MAKIKNNFFLILNFFFLNQKQSIHHNLMNTKDIVRDVLEKDPKERTDEDIDILFEFMQSFPVFIFIFISSLVLIKSRSIV